MPQQQRLLEQLRVLHFLASLEGAMRPSGTQGRSSPLRTSEAPVFTSQDLLRGERFFRQTVQLDKERHVQPKRYRNTHYVTPNYISQ